MSIKLSVIVCTRNRENYFRKALRSLLVQTPDKQTYEIIVVDNASTDNTRLVVQQECKHTENVRYFIEPRVGIPYARNRGWTEAKGDFLCFLDDDEIAPPDWLSCIVKALEEPGNRVGFFGGPIAPIWEAKRPQWLSNDILFCLGLIDFSNKPAVINITGKCLLTGNIVISKSALEEIGGFNERLKRGSDTLMQMQLMKKGYIGYYNPEMVVSHHVSEARLKKSFFLRWFFRYGIDVSKIQILVEKITLRQRIRLCIFLFFHVFSNITQSLRFSKLCFAMTACGRFIGLITIK